MRGFARRQTVAQVLAWVDGAAVRLPAESVGLAAAAGRVLAADVHSDVDVPGFDRAMMDGFALQASATLGASAYNPLELAIVGESMPGRPFPGRIDRGQAVRIMTGAPVPAGADAVLPVEHATFEADRLAARDAVAPGRHVGRRGEDVPGGARVFAAGRQLRPQDLGLLSSIGVALVDVVRRPLVRIVVTGNELLPAGTAPREHRIPDANSPMLAALLQRDGGRCVGMVMAADEPDAIGAALRDEADVVLVSGGSSVGRDDHAPMLLAAQGELAVHGIAMRPSSPAGMGRLGDRLVFLLPGNPVSCLCAYDFFAGRAIRALGGRARRWPYARIRRPLRRKLVSVVGRVDYARVALADEAVEPLAIGGASILSSTTRADGFVIVPDDSEGWAEGTDVEVYLYG